MAEPYSQVLQSVSLNLSRAFINFFEGRAKFPNFKSRHGKQSIQYPQNVKIVDQGLKLPKIGIVPAKIHRIFEGKLKTVTVSLTPSGKYFASLLFDDEQLEAEKTIDGKAVGIDLGLTHFAIISDGSKFDNPRALKKHSRNLKRKQQKLSRKVKGSNRRQKARRLFPSSKTCSVCLNRIGDLPLDVRSWQCQKCGTKHDRDVNAAINIREESLRLLALGTSAAANGGKVRPRVGRRKSSVSKALPGEIGSLHHTA